MKRELKNQWMLGFVMLGILLFSNLQAQDKDSVSTQTQTTTTVSSVDTDDADDNNSTSQDYDGAPRGGIKAGMNISNLITDEVTDKNARIGFHAGVYGQLFSSRAFALQPEVNYSTKGNKVVKEYSVIDQETKFNLSYIDVPVLAVFKIGPTAEIHAGPYWAYMVGANIDSDGDLSDGFNEIDRDNFNKWDFGIAGGLAFHAGKAATIGARYSYGLNEIAKSEGAKRLIGDAKNSVGQVYVAFNFAARD